jgi:hypothetical protein
MVCEGGLLGAEFLEGEESGCGEGTVMGASISLSKLDEEAELGD